MGTWNTTIDGNDTFQDVYLAFMNLYNEGVIAGDISKRIIADHKALFEDHDDKHNALFGVAFAQWETLSLDRSTLDEIKRIIDGEHDLELWKELGADIKTLKRRKIALDKFLLTISNPRDKPKRRLRPKFRFSQNVLVNIVAPDQLKSFNISEQFTNDKYIHTGSLMSWTNGGCSILYFNGRDKSISAKWLSSQTLEITHEKDIVFTKKDDSAYFYGDTVEIIYKVG